MFYFHFFLMITLELLQIISLQLCNAKYAHTKLSSTLQMRLHLFTFRILIFHSCGEQSMLIFTSILRRVQLINRNKHQRICIWIKWIKLKKWTIDYTAMFVSIYQIIVNTGLELIASHTYTIHIYIYMGCRFFVLSCLFMCCSLLS